mgnify:CR=1 FL=1|tara:strand:- start:7 stop:321 length:315 start_codon:yes stop_codon:yes gene_type:complete
MITANGLIHLGYTPIVDFILQDDSNGNGAYIKEWLSSDSQPTDSAIQAADTEAQAAYDAQEYARKRKAKYDALNQFELISDDAINGTTTHKDAIVAIKSEFPKP